MNRQMLADMLGAFAAARNGRGADYLTSMQYRNDRDEQRKALQKQQNQQRQDQLSKERMQAWAVDNRAINHMLKNGQIDRAVTRLNNRLFIGQGLPGFDPKSTQAIKELVTLYESEKQAGRGENANQALQAAIAETDFADQQFSAMGLIQAPEKPQNVKLGKDDRIVNPVTGEEVVGASSTVEKPTTAPREIIEALPENIRPQAEAAYTAAGGGSSGLSAVNDVSERDAESRSEESANQKARGVQMRAIDLTTRILANPDTKDVVGSIGGSALGTFLNPSNYLDQGNANAIADIEELADILTTENLDLMTGVLSESDIKLLRSVAGGGLDRKRGNQQFERDVNRVLETLITAERMSAEDLSSLSDEQFAVYEAAIERKYGNE